MTDNRFPTCAEAEHESNLWELYVMYCNGCAILKPRSFTDWRKEFESSPDDEQNAVDCLNIFSTSDES